MNYEKPSGPMHDVIRRALEELKLYGNPYGCINIVNACIENSDAMPLYERYQALAREATVAQLLPARHDGGRANGAGPGPHAPHGLLHTAPTSSDRQLHRGVAGAVVRGDVSSPLSPIFTGNGGGASAFSPVSGAGPSAATVAGGVRQGAVVSDATTTLTSRTTTTTTSSAGGGGAAEKRQHSLNAVQVLRLLLVRCDAYSQTKQNAKALADAKMAVLLSQRRSAEAYFACGRECRRLYQIRESVAFFEAGFGVLGSMKRHVMHNLRAMLLAQGYNEDGTRIADTDNGTDSRHSRSRGQQSTAATGGSSGGGGGNDSSVSESAITSAFLYQTFYLPEAYVRMVNAARGASPAPAMDEEADYWAQRGYRMEDVARLGLVRREEEQREVAQLRTFQALKSRQTRRLRATRRRQNRELASSGTGGDAHGMQLHLDPVLLDSKSASRTDLHTLHDAYGDDDSGSGSDDDTYLVAPSIVDDAMSPSSSDRLGIATSSPAQRSHSAAVSVGVVVEPSGAADGDGHGADGGDEWLVNEEQVFSFFPDAGTSSPAPAARVAVGRRVSLAATPSGSAPRRGSQQSQAAGGAGGPQPASLFRRNTETELLFALNHYGMSPTELSAWIRLYRESRALERMKRRKSFPRSVFGTTLVLLDRKVSAIRNGVALVVENALLPQVPANVRGLAGVGPHHHHQHRHARRVGGLVNSMQFVGCTAPDGQYSSNFYFPESIAQGFAGFSLLQPKGWGGYSGCICFALLLDPSPKHHQHRSHDADTDADVALTDHITVFLYFDSPMVGSVKYGVRCVTGIRVADLRRAFYEVNGQRGGVHGIAGANENADAESLDDGNGAEYFPPGPKTTRAPPPPQQQQQQQSRFGPPPPPAESLQWPRQETAAQRAGRIAAMKAVRVPPSATWLTSQTLLLRGEPDARGVVPERRIKVSVRNGGGGGSGGSGSGGGGGGGGSASAMAAVSNHNVLLFSVSERLPVRLKSVELLPALEYAGPAVLKRVSALSRRYRELVNNFPPPTFVSPAAFATASSTHGAGGGGGGAVAGASSVSGVGGSGVALAGVPPSIGAVTPYTAPSMPTVRRGAFAFYPDYCLHSDRLSSPWVVRDKAVVLLRMHYAGCSMSQEEFVVSCPDTSAAGVMGAAGGNSYNTNTSTATGTVVDGRQGIANASILSDLDSVTTAGAGAGGSSPRASAKPKATVLFYFSADSQSRSNAHVYYGDRRCPFFVVKESWLPFSSAVYLQSAASSNRSFAAVNNNNGAMTLSLTTAPRPTGAEGGGGGGGSGGMGTGNAGGGGGGAGAEAENVLYTVRRRPSAAAAGDGDGGAPAAPYDRASTATSSSQLDALGHGVGGGFGAVALTGSMARATHFTVWRSATQGNGAEIVAEIRVLCSPYPMTKGMQVGEVRLLPGADALLVTSLMFLLARS